MYIAPSSTVKLYGGVQIIPGRQIAFSSKANQTAYFASKLVQSDTPCTYVRRTYRVKVEVALSVVKNCNYISFVNPDFENITWYAKIVNYEYVNNGCTEIFYAIDYFQTFMFDVNFEVCTMDREQLSVTDYDKSVANPYDYSIIEMQTDEDIALPDDVYEYPEITGSKYLGGSKRTFMPGGYEDNSAEKLADNTMMYTIILSSPITEFSWDGVNDWYSYEGTLPKADAQALCEFAGMFNAKLDYIYTSRYLPVGNNISGWKTNEIGGTGSTDYKGVSWIDWNPQNPFDGEDKGYGCFGMNKNNVDNQTLILATSSYTKMSKMLNIIAGNDIVSSIVGCYMLPLSFLCMLHAQTNVDNLSISYSPLSEQTSSAPDGMNLVDGDNQITVFKEEIHPIFTSGIKNKKLFTFPYHYIKVTAPNGSCKEYKFEDFTELQSKSTGVDTDFDVLFTLLADITNTPLLEMYPYLYKIYSTTTNNNKMSFRKKLNVSERMEFSDFPQQAYMTDAYLAYVGNQYNAMLRNEPMRENLNTQEYWTKNYKNLQNDKDIWDGVSDFFGIAGAGISTVAGAATGGAIGDVGALGNKLGTMYSSTEVRTAERAAEVQKNQAALNLRKEALASAEWGHIQSMVSSTLSSAKPAFRANDYHAGGGSGTLPYYMSGFKYTFDVMKLKTAFLEKFDNYFTNYGYKSTRTGVPHIATYLGGTKTGNAPKFLQNEQGYYVTYIKTVDCKVYSTMDMITEFFETLFNAGIQLIDGDTLLPSNNNK